MKTALITTTINVPRVLRNYRQLDPDVRFFVAADLDTDAEAYELCDDIGNCESIRPTVHGFLPWAPYNSIARRNVALLEALRWGADVIVSVDDDNIPLPPGNWVSDSYFENFDLRLTQPYHGLSIRGQGKYTWFDVGQFLGPVAPHRGIPIDRLAAHIAFDPVVGVKVGVAAGICLGDPDISAVTRIADHPTVHRVSEVLRAGIVVDPLVDWTVFNSQNTAIVRELAPAWMMWPCIGRYDDIMASLVVQRIARERGYHIHFGQPFVWQQRNAHDLVGDLEGEVWGMRNVARVAEEIDRIDLGSATTVTEQVRRIFFALEHRVPIEATEAGLSWCDAVEGVL